MSLEILNINYINDPEGVPVSVRLVGDLKFQGTLPEVFSCKLAYDDILAEEGIEKANLGSEGSHTVSIVSPAAGRLDKGKWSMCCDTIGLSDFDSIGDSAVCASEGGG